MNAVSQPWYQVIQKSFLSGLHNHPVWCDEDLDTQAETSQVPVAEPAFQIRHSEPQSLTLPGSAKPRTVGAYLQVMKGGYL